MRKGIVMTVLVGLAPGLLGCNARPSPTSPSSIPQSGSPPTLPAPGSANGLLVFKDPRSGFSTTNLHDVDDEIVQLTTSNELIWQADGTRLAGFRLDHDAIPAIASCGCWLVVRFGIRNDERRAYVTADYGHDNPGTIVDLGVAGGALVVTRTNIYVPGTTTLSGVITEATASGLRPIEDAGIWRLNEEQTGWDVARTDRNGFYQLRGLYDGTRRVAVIKEGYETANSIVTIDGETRFDTRLVKQ